MDIEKTPATPPIHDPRMRGFRNRTSVRETIELIDSRVRSLGAEMVSLSEASGRVLAEPVIASVAIPPFDRAAMDGYALRGEETFGSSGYSPAVFRLIGQSRPGRPFEGSVGPGETVAIATGAPMPSGADAVAPVEFTGSVGPSVHVVEAVSPGRHVGKVGEDVAIGDQVLASGRKLRPQDLGVLSALGRGVVSVVRKPIVMVIVTGQELLSPGSRPRDFQIADMNSPMLAALIERDGGICQVIGPVPDDRSHLVQVMEEAVTSSDVLLVSGGSSTGPEDYAPTILAELGELAIHGIAIRPSSPAGVGFIGNVPVGLLPGNPVSCLCAYDFFAGRIVRRLAGRSPDWSYAPKTLPLAEKLVSALGRVDYARVRIVDGRVVPLATSGASILSSASRADGFVVISADREGFPAGDLVEVWLYL